MYKRRAWCGSGWIALAAMSTGCGVREASDWWSGTGLPLPVQEPLSLLRPASPGRLPALPKVLFSKDSGWLLSRSGESEGYGASPGPNLQSLPPGFALQATETSGWHEGRSLVTETLTFRGLPIHRSSIKRMIAGTETLSLSASIPAGLLSGFTPEPAEFTLGSDAARAAATTRLGLASDAWSEGESVYVAADAELLPAWRFRVNGNASGVPLEVLVHGQTGTLLEVRALAFGVDGHAHMYEENRVASSSMADVTLAGLSGDGSKLSHEIFKVLNCRREEPRPASGNCVQLATSSAGDFGAIPWADERYDELVSYHALGRAVAWNRQVLALPGVPESEMRHGWGSNRANLGLNSTKQLVVYTRAKARSSTGTPTYDNAQYLPAGMTGTEGPMIVIGTGWEEGAEGPERPLRYLGKDSDVVMHEFHHHINFRSLTDVDGETGSMHEGLADYFTYAITGNNKLGEAIVPSTAVQGALRAGNMTGKIQTYAKAPVHIAGQFWSTTLWDVRNALGPWKDGLHKADKIIADAVDLSSSSETYYGFIKAMGHAAEVFATTNGEDAVALKKKIYRVFADRGFVEAPNDNGDLPAPGAMISGTISSGSGAAPIPSPGKTSGSSKKKGWCGVVAQGEATTGSSLALVLLALGIPLLGLRRRSPKKIHTTKNDFRR